MTYIKYQNGSRAAPGRQGSLARWSQWHFLAAESQKLAYVPKVIEQLTNAGIQRLCRLGCESPI
jgi:hypothetical protein